MITFVTGSIFDSQADCLVNPVNTVGVMGAGLALQFKLSFPLNFSKYKAACDVGDLRTGSVFLTRDQTKTGHPVYIANFPTKRHCKDSSKLEWIEEGLSHLHEILTIHHIQKVAIPRLSSSLGALLWENVLPLIVKEFESDKNKTAYVYTGGLK